MKCSPQFLQRASLMGECLGYVNAIRMDGNDIKVSGQRVAVRAPVDICVEKAVRANYHAVAAVLDIQALKAKLKAGGYAT